MQLNSIPGHNPSRLSICQLTSGHSLDDERVLHRMAKTAALHGFKSTVAGPSHGQEKFDGVEFVACPKVERRVTGLARLGVWMQLAKWALGTRHDVFHFHDPDLLLTGLVLKLFGRKVIYDVHDDYQASFKDRLAGRKWLVGWFPAVWWALEKNISRLFDGLVVADRHLAEKFAVCKPVILGNFPDASFTRPAQTEGEKTFNLLYVGGVSYARGLGAVLEALRLIDLPDVRLHVVGGCNDPRLMSELKSDPRIVLHGKVAWTDLGQFYERSHLGLALYQPMASFMYYPGENSVKIIEYMAARLPVLTSDFPGLRKFVVGQGIGLVVDPVSASDIAAAIVRFHDDEAFRSSAAAKAYQLYQEQYNWESHRDRLVKLYQDIGGRQG